MSKTTKRWQVTLAVEDVASFDRGLWPVTSGVPFPRALMRADEDLALRDERGKAVPLQHEVLARWPDGSVRWALLDFQVHSSPQGKRRLRLSPGQRAVPPKPVAVRRNRGRCTVETGAADFTLSNELFGIVNSVVLPRVGVESCVSLVDESGQTYTARAEAPPKVCCRGPMRATLEFRGHHVNEEGQRFFAFVARMSFYAGLPLIQLEYRFLNDNTTGVFGRIRELTLRLQPKCEGFTASVGRGEGQADRVTSRSLRLFQRDADRSRLALRSKALRSGRAPGWIQTVGDKGLTTTIVVRDFWQQWPKGLSVDKNGEIAIELCPRLNETEYEGAEPRNKSYYLFDGGSYLFKVGLAKTHEVWLCFDHQEGHDPEAFCQAVNAPLFAAPDPKWSATCSVWGDLVPEGHLASKALDPVAAQAFDAYQAAIERDRDYGLLNWGDWYGERKYNWGNHEYDTPHAMFLNFARTGDVRYAHAGEAAARHMADVDVLHCLNEDYLNGWELAIGCRGQEIRKGAVYLHAIGHVGGYFDREWARQQYPGSYYYSDLCNLGHLWNEGLIEHHCVTGDPWSKQVALDIADNLVAYSKQPGFTWWFGPRGDPHCGRVAGWPLTALMAAYQLTWKRKYLAAAKHIVEHALADQDPVCGGWLYQLYPGHCFCERRKHVGMATFITSVLLNGMIRYHQVAGDPRVADSIVRAVDFVISDTWVESEGKFRYTSCPASDLTSGHGVHRPISYAYRLARKPRHLAVLGKALATTLECIREEIGADGGTGKGYSALIRELPHVVADLADAAAVRLDVCLPV